MDESKFEAERGKTFRQALGEIQKSNLAIGFRLAEFGAAGKWTIGASRNSAPATGKSA
jgi:hypothetical protein